MSQCGDPEPLELIWTNRHLQLGCKGKLLHNSFQSRADGIPRAPRANKYGINGLIRG